MTEPVLLQFPSKNVICRYLENHPLTKDLNVTNNKVIQVVATYFSHKEMIINRISKGVLLTLANLDTDLNLTFAELQFLRIDFCTALKDCAEGKGF